MGAFPISQSAVPSCRAPINYSNSEPSRHAKDRPGRVQLAQRARLLLPRCSQTTLTSGKIYNPPHPRKNRTLFSSDQTTTPQIQLSSLCQGCLQKTLLCARSFSILLISLQRPRLILLPPQFLQLPLGI